MCVCAGISCPRGARPGAGGVTLPGEPFGEEATQFTKELCLQREVGVIGQNIDNIYSMCFPIISVKRKHAVLITTFTS